MKSGMSWFFNLLYPNWMECPKKWFWKEFFCRKLQKWFFLTTWGQKIKNLALLVKFQDNFGAYKLFKWLKDIKEHRWKERQIQALFSHILSNLMHLIEIRSKDKQKSACTWRYFILCLIVVLGWFKSFYASKLSQNLTDEARFLIFWPKVVKKWTFWPKMQKNGQNLQYLARTAHLIFS